MTTLRALALAAALLGSGCAAERMIVAQDPPAPKQETPPPSPGAHVIWHSGRWVWDADKELFFWEAGRWEPARSGQVWIPGYWERVEEDGRVLGWAWVDPRWEPAR